MVSSTCSGSSVTAVPGQHQSYRDAGRHQKPVPAHAHYEEYDRLDLLSLEISRIRNHAVFKLMRNHGLSANQVAKLTLGSINLEKKKLLLKQGCDASRCDFQISNDTADALSAYLRVRSPSEERRLFLVEQGAERGTALDVISITRDRGRLLQR